MIKKFDNLSFYRYAYPNIRIKENEGNIYKKNTSNTLKLRIRRI